MVTVTDSAMVIMDHDHPLQRYGHSRMLGAYGTPVLGRRRGRRGSWIAPLERAMVVSNRLSIVTVALSVTIQPQFAIECLRRSNQQGGGSVWAQIQGCSPWSRPVMSGLKRANILG